MATWITHLMIADRLLAAFPQLDRRGFCAGNIAPDCNVENEDWTSFTPSREVTHWMLSSRKNASDCSHFRDEYLLPRLDSSISAEEHSFLLGYYAHLITDAEFQRFIRDPDRVRAVWDRIKADGHLSSRAAGLPETWDTVKLLIPKADRMSEIEVIEAEYLKQNPSSGYLTEILPLSSFPDYIDYLPAGSIVRKIGVMGVIPSPSSSNVRHIAISRAEYFSFVQSASSLVIRAFDRPGLLP